MMIAYVMSVQRRRHDSLCRSEKGFFGFHWGLHQRSLSYALSVHSSLPHCQLPSAPLIVSTGCGEAKEAVMLVEKAIQLWLGEAFMALLKVYALKKFFQNFYQM